MTPYQLEKYFDDKIEFLSRRLAYVSVDLHKTQLEVESLKKRITELENNKGDL